MTSGNETFEDQLEQEREGENCDSAGICIGSIAIIKWLRNQKEPESRDWWYMWMAAISSFFSELKIDAEDFKKYQTIAMGLANEHPHRHLLVKKFYYFEDNEIKAGLLVNLQIFVEIEKQYAEPAYEEHQEMIDSIFEDEFDQNPESIEELKKTCEEIVDKAREQGLDKYKAPPLASKPKEKKKIKKENKYEKIEIMLRAMALIAVYVAGSDRKSSEDPIDEKEAKVAIEVSSKMFESEEWQDRLFFRDLKPDELEKTTQGCQAGGLGSIRVDIGNDREKIIDELEEQVNLLREHYSYTEDKSERRELEIYNNKHFMVHFATNVANASGGILGFGKISKKEKESITNVFRIFDPELDGGGTDFEEEANFRIDEMVEMIKEGKCTY